MMHFYLCFSIIDPDKPYGVSDAIRIQLLRFLALLVENASTHIHDPTNKRHGNKLRRIMTFAWPCLLSKNCVDPATKYHGHLLLSHIIAKFAIHKRIVLQTFYSLLKVCITRKFMSHLGGGRWQWKSLQCIFIGSKMSCRYAPWTLFCYPPCDFSS